MNHFLFDWVRRRFFTRNATKQEDDGNVDLGDLNYQTLSTPE